MRLKIENCVLLFKEKIDAGNNYKSYDDQILTMIKRFCHCRHFFWHFYITIQIFMDYNIICVLMTYYKFILKQFWLVNYPKISNLFEQTFILIGPQEGCGITKFDHWQYLGNSKDVIIFGQPSNCAINVNYWQKNKVDTE